MTNKIPGNNEATKRYRARNRGRVLEKDRNHKRETYNSVRKPKLLAMYGITVDDYNKIFESQAGYCLGCGKHQSELNHSLCVDHNHETGIVRGLLCRSCNLILGNSKDNSDTLIRLSEYLKKREGELWQSK